MLMLEKPAITLSIFGAVLAASLSLSAQAPAPTPQPSTPATPAAAPRPTRPPLTPEQEAARQKAAAEQEADHADMMRQLGITSMRPGADSDKKSPHAANFDEAKVPAYTPPPDPLVFPDGKKVKTAQQWWSQRRPQIVKLLETEMYGSIPADVPRVTWSVVKTKDDTLGGTPTHITRLKGHVDNSIDPAITVDIDVILALPANAKGPVPVIAAFDFLPNDFGDAPMRFPGMAPRPGAAPVGPTPREQVLARGYGYAAISTNSIQPDNGAGLASGIIGLTNKGARRTPTQWGVLRAWGWGASRLLDYLETSPAVNAKQVGVFGHSRYGKAALVAMAFDPRFAIGYISSSGEGGAKLSRRDFGERVENLTNGGEYHWMAGNFLKYGGPLTPNDLPVDAHDLIALCAPRPVFLSAGSPDAGDAWVDARGSFLSAVAAGDVYRLLGAKDLGTSAYPPTLTEVGPGEIAFRQHDQGHTPNPNWPAFLDFALRELPKVPQLEASAHEPKVN
jgi:hypothetical protein